MFSLFEEPFFRIYEIIKKIEGEEFKDKVSSKEREGMIINNYSFIFEEYWENI